MAVKTAYLSKAGRDFRLSPHFTLKEMASKDGSDKVLYSTELIAMLEKLRAYGGFTVVLNSGYRTSAYNKKIGGASASQHVKGTAADVSVRKGGKAVDARLICCLCQSLGFKGVAYISPTAVHLDMRASGSYRGDERKGYGGNVKNDFYRYFGVRREQVEALKTKPKPDQTERPEREEEEMTQAQFNKMMETYLSSLKAASPAPWSKDARSWAEKNGIVLGDEKGKKAYGELCTVERAVVLLYRLAGLLGKNKS